MSLSKLPLLCSSTWAMYAALTPPHKPSSGEVLLKPTMYERFMAFTARTSMPTIRNMYLIGGLIEIAAIIAKTVDPTLFPDIIAAAIRFLRTLQDTPASPAFIVGGILTTLGGLLRWQCYRTLGRHFTFMLSMRQDHKLVTWGPYAWVRHPAYTGLTISLVGLSIMHCSEGSFFRASGISNVPGVRPLAIAWLVGLTLANVGLIRRMRSEDDMLRESFGEEWTRWARKVKYMLIPGIY